MTRAIEDELAAAMRDQVAGLTPAPGLVTRAARRHRRRTRIRAGASVTAAAGVTAAVVTAGLLGAPPKAGSATPGAAGPARTPSARPAPGPVPASVPPSSPQARLLAAMTSSAQLSYRMHLVNLSVLPHHKVTVTSPPRDLISWYADYTGVFDPRTSSGSGVSILRYDSGGLGNPSRYGKPAAYEQVRIIGDTFFTKTSASASSPATGWTSGQGDLAQALDLDGGAGWAPTTDSSADPAVLLATVSSLGQVRLASQSGSGPQALDTYAFSYHIAGDDSDQPHVLSGTIVVHRESNLIASIAFQTTVIGANPQIGDGQPLTFRTVLTFSDYGVAVSVRPPASSSPSA